MAFLDELLAVDIRNNSAWNQRYFVLHFNVNKPPNVEKYKKEAEYAMASLHTVSRNEAAWNYLYGLVRNAPALDTAVLTFLRDMLAAHKDNVMVWRGVVDIAEFIIGRDVHRNNKVMQKEWKECVVTCCEHLVEQDRVRTAYWTWRLQDMAVKS
jgi:protein farnesyltransferase/geranylgeranyltransferase type-1 subunit alpha